jgi:superfamily II DNA or RNA helicase
MAPSGEVWVGGRRPTRFKHVFASIQTLAANGLGHLDPGHFDVVIVDEFHHAAAPAYRTLLDWVQPRELLGLTATPERSDGLPILEWFDGRITAELRLWDAVDQHYLTPFAYYGIADVVDLSEVPWQRGRGYDAKALTAVYTSDDARARQVLQELVDHVGDLRAVRVLGFCVSVSHARFMARRFRDAATAIRRASRVFSLDDDAQRATVATDPAILDDADGPVVIAEWQRHPPVWDHVRRQVDAGAPPGRYLLTGSALPVRRPRTPAPDGSCRCGCDRCR